MKLYRGFATVGVMTILSRVLGFVRDVLIAAVLGTSFVADAFFVAYRVPNMFRRLFAEGAFDAAFIPLFARRLHADGPEAARAFAGQGLWPASPCSSWTFTILGEIAMPWFMVLLAPGFRDDPEKFALAVMLARIALPYLVCMSLVALYTGVLNALGRFAIAAFTPSLLNVVLILRAARPRRQAAMPSKGRAGVVLTWGIAASGLLQIVVVALAAARFGMSLPPERPRLTPDMQRLMALAAPGIVAGGICSDHRRYLDHHRHLAGPRRVLALLRRAHCPAPARRNRRRRRRRSSPRPQSQAPHRRPSGGDRKREPRARTRASAHAPRCNGAAPGRQCRSCACCSSTAPSPRPTPMPPPICSPRWHLDCRLT